MKKYYFILIFACNISFGQTAENHVKIPKLILTKYDTIISSNFQKMQSATAKIYGIGVKDSLKLTDAKWEMESRYFPLKKKEDFVFFVDASNDTFHSHFMKRHKINLPPPPVNKGVQGDYKTNHDSLYARYKANLERKARVHHESYPFFLYNKSRGKITVSNPISGPDLYIIMEALDKNKVWRPIEFWKQYSFLCGTGHIDYELKPNTFLIGAVKRYSGNYKTKLRLKLSTTGFILYSNEFDGEVNYGQFSTSNVMKDLITRFSYGDNAQLKSRMERAFLNN